MYKYLFSAILSFCSLISTSQDITYARYIIETLASDEMHGRGYVNEGDKKAANFIESELKSLGIVPFGNNYFQEVTFPVNTYPGKMVVVIDNDTLKPVYDYSIATFSKGFTGKFPLLYLPEEADNDSELFDSLKNINYTGKALATHFTKHNVYTENVFEASVVIDMWSKPLWWISEKEGLSDIPVLMIRDSVILNKKEIEIDFESKFIEKHVAQNVIGHVSGIEYPDSFIVFSAHYDHMGEMGAGNIFHGANDNASGVAMVLDIAKYFKDNPAKYSVAFMLFAGEEAGLYGSKEFVKSPLFPLSRISSVINLDMVGTGSIGIGIVGGKENPRITSKIVNMNDANNYLDSIRIRSASCNSDHCPFHEAGVPSVFIYTMGKEFTEYHNLDDVPEKLPLTKYSELFKLLVGFVEE